MKTSGSIHNARVAWLTILAILLLLPLASANEWNGSISPLTFALRLDNNATDFGLYGNNFTNVSGVVYQSLSFKTSTGASNFTSTTQKLTAVNSNVSCQANTDCFYNWWFNRNQNLLTKGLFGWDASNYMEQQRGSGSSLPNAQRLFLGGGLIVAVYTNSTTAGNGFANNSWYMETLVRYANGNVSFYINGTVVAIGTYTGQIGGNGAKMVIGDDFNGDDGNGEMFDSFYFSNSSVPNATTISILYSSFQGTNCPLNGSCIPPPNAPSISNVQNTSITNYSVNISFNITSVAGNYTILFYNASGIRNLYNYSSYSLGGFNQSIYGLNIYTQYFYNITTCSNAQICSTTGEYNFTTLSTNSTLYLNAFNDFNGSRIGGINFNITDNAGTSITLTSSGTADTSTPIPTGTYQITLNNSPNYLGANTTLTISTTTSYNFTNLYGATLNINSSTAISHQNIPFNITITQSGYARNYTSTTNLTVYLQSAANNYILNATYPLYFPITQTISSLTKNTITGFTLNLSNNNLTVTARDISNNATINTFSVSAYNQQYTTTINSTATFGNTTLFLEQGYTYNLTVSQSLYGTVITPITGNMTYQNITIYLAPTNNSAIFINIYDEDTGLFLNQVTPTNTTATIQIISPDYAINVSTGSSILVPNLLPGNYHTLHTSQLYNPRNYYFDLQNQTSPTINLYLLNSTRSSFFPVLVVDQNSQGLANATVKFLRYYLPLNAYTVVAMVRTDATGSNIIDLVPDTVEYQIIVDYQGTTVYTSSPTRYAAGSTIRLPANTGDDFIEQLGNLANIQTTLNYSNTTQITTYTWNSIQNIVTSAQLIVTRDNPLYGSTTICNYIINTSTGSTTCNTSGLSGSFTATGSIYQTGNTNPYIRRIIQFTQQLPTANTVLGIQGLFWAAIIIIVFTLLGAYDPGLSLFGTGVGTVITYALNLYTIMFACIISFIIILIWTSKRVEEA